MEVGGGGGYGDPQRRSRALVSRDIARGYISKEAARSDYGFDG
jgi:N-methylhydantoinase B/oxoprolinase/acetone carboxylase alpha subunit